MQSLQFIGFSRARKLRAQSMLFRIVDGANVLPDHPSQPARRRIAPISSCDLRRIRFAGFSPRCFIGPFDLAGCSGVAWIYDVAAKKLAGIEFEIVELSSRSGTQSSVNSLHWIGDLFDITASFS